MKREDYLTKIKNAFYTGRTPVESGQFIFIDLRKKIRQLDRIITEHIGSDGKKAHLTATEYVNGFMSTQQVHQLNASSGKTTWIKGVNVLNLTFGHYMGNTLTGLPMTNTGLWYIDVKQHPVDELCKIITVTQSATGKTWVRSWHTGGVTNSVPNEWRSIKSETLLWSGNATNAQDKMPCAISPRIFDEIKIEGELFDGTSIRGFKSNIITSDNIKITDTNLSDVENSFIFQIYECNIRLGANNEFYILNNRQVVYNIPENTIENGTTGTFIINKIIGVK